MTDQPPDESAIESRTVAKVLLRLIPCIVVLYVFNYLDRVNVSFAKLTMNDDLGFSETVYGIGSGIFFVSYFLFEVPSNLIMQRVGARIWLARIMISWGIISSAMLFVRGPTSFYTLRFLLGAAEAGFAPGILLYLTYWLPLRHQAKAVAWFLTATALSGMIGSPLAGALLRLDGAHCFGHPLAGWQWLFLLEGIPSVLGGFAIYFLLTNRPQEARWLSPEEQQWLTGRIEADRLQRECHGHTSLAAGLTLPAVWLFSLIYGTMMFGFQGINFWLATIVKQVTGLADNLYVGLLCAIPFTAAMIAMVLLGRHSDRTGERRGHAAVCCAVGALGLLLCALSDSPVWAIACLALAAAGIWSSLGPFWALPPLFLTGSAAAAGLALINSIGNLGGGFLGQYAMGALKDYTKTYKPGLLVVSISLALAAGLILSLRRFLSTFSDRR
ncbi:MAG TPA: MFS transporter [Phycisphaerae bacterium]|nr:MFS transporter [Phycisphaerae bacterium]HRY67134.1 MFS transporter [Phycisphaerae bacterium]HSA26497.1 MFS transporter [Phycisphaerae bacterium]